MTRNEAQGRSVPTYTLELTLDEVAALINHLSARLIKFPDDDLRSVLGKAMLVYSPATMGAKRKLSLK